MSRSDDFDRAPATVRLLTLEDRRVAVWLGLLAFVAYSYFYAGGGWNQNSQFDLTRSLVERHSFVIDAFASNTGDTALQGGHVYSNKAPGLSWLATVPYSLLYALERSHGLDPSNALLLTLNGYLCSLLLVAVPGALIPVLIFRRGREQGIDAMWSALIAMTVALGTQLFPYATVFMVPVPSAMLLLGTLLVRRHGVAGFLGGLAAVTNYLCAPAILAAALIRRKWSFLAACSIPLLLLAIYQQICFGSFYTNSVAKADPRFLDQHSLMGIIGTPSLAAFMGITISPYRGVFYFAPVLLMIFPAVVFWLRDRDDLPILGFVAFTTLLFFGFNVTFNGWEAGFGIGARYLVPLIPLWGLALLRIRGRWRGLLVVLALVSFGFNFAAAAVDPQPSATIPAPLTQYVLPLLVSGHFSPGVPITPPWSAATFTGHTSVNRMAPDEAVVFQRHPPGSPPSDWASFNLGEFSLGSGKLRSLVPIAMLLLIGGAAILWRVARMLPGSSPRV